MCDRCKNVTCDFHLFKAIVLAFEQGILHLYSLKVGYNTTACVLYLFLKKFKSFQDNFLERPGTKSA